MTFPLGTIIHTFFDVYNHRWRSKYWRVRAATEIRLQSEDSTKKTNILQWSLPQAGTWNIGKSNRWTWISAVSSDGLEPTHDASTEGRGMFWRIQRWVQTWARFQNGWPEDVIVNWRLCLQAWNWEGCGYRVRIPLRMQISSMISTPGRDIEQWGFETLDTVVSRICTVYSHGFQPRRDA